ncbi:MAG TPA: CHRD domain-containing protein [Methylomirabilota bacterium]
MQPLNHVRGPERLGQGILAGEFEEVVAAIRAGRTYANVHSAAFPPGEIRGQLRHDRGR